MKWYKTSNYDEYKKLSKEGKDAYMFYHLDKNDIKGIYSTMNSYVLIFNTILLIAIISVNNKTLVPEYAVYVMKILTLALAGLLFGEVIHSIYKVYKLSKLR